MKVAAVKIIEQTPTVIVGTPGIQGPPGPPGRDAEIAISTDAGNALRRGSDDGLFVGQFEWTSTQW